MISLVTFLLSFGLAYLGTIGLLRIRLRKSFVDVPNRRSSHEVPKPRFGGIALVGSFLVVYAVLVATVPDSRTFLPFVGGAVILFTIGVADDWRGLPVLVRFGAQIVSALIVVAFGGVVEVIQLPMAGQFQLGALAIPFTVIFVLTCINFYNFIDGIDGLAAGSAFICAGFLSLIAFILGHLPLALLSLAVAGASLGFLQFNFPPSRLFMGDSGSTFLGFFFAYVAVTGNSMSPALPIFIPVLILSSLFLDVALTLVKRAMRGERIFDAHHTHYYQRLLSLGLNHKQVTILEYTMTVLLGLSAVIYFKAGGLFPVFITLCWVVIFTASIMKIRSLERGDRMFWERRTVLVVAIDLFLISWAYIGAYFLRLNFQFTQAEGMAMLKAYPLVLIIRSACFHKFGLYKGVWKYTGTQDLLKIIKAVTTGSAIILALVVLLYRFVAFPRSLFLIEYFLLIVSLGGARFAFRMFHEFGKEAHSSKAKRLAIIGAGDYADQIARGIKNAERSSANIICFVDDDKNKIGLTLRGLPIEGPISRLEEICTGAKIDSLVLAISSYPQDKLRSLLQTANRLGVQVEGRDGGLVRQEEPAPVLFDRLGRNLGRPELFGRPTEDLFLDPNVYYQNKRVLVAGDPAPVTGGLVRELLHHGADVTVQVSSPEETARINNLNGDRRLTIFVGSLTNQPDVSRLIELSGPDVIFLNVNLDVAEAVNSVEYLRRRAIRGADLLVRSLERHPLESFNALMMWGNQPAGRPETVIGAAAEILILNAEEISQSAPTVIRIPNVLTEKTLRRMLDRRTRNAAGIDGSFEMFETEVVAMVLGTAASHRQRALFVPAAGRPMSKDAIRQALLRTKFDPAPEIAAGQDPDYSGARLFPVETAKPAAREGLSEVAGPVFPADGALKEAASRLALGTRADAREEFLNVFSQKLRLEPDQAKQLTTELD